MQGPGSGCPLWSAVQTGDTVTPPTSAYIHKQEELIWGLNISGGIGGRVGDLRRGSIWGGLYIADNSKRKQETLDLVLSFNFAMGKFDIWKKEWNFLTSKL